MGYTMRVDSWRYTEWVAVRIPTRTLVVPTVHQPTLPKPALGWCCAWAVKAHSFARPRRTLPRAAQQQQHARRLERRGLEPLLGA